MLWIKGPFVASMHDSRICQSDGEVNDDRLQGKRGIDDSAYRKIESMTLHREGHSKETTNFINRAVLVMKVSTLEYKSLVFFLPSFVVTRIREKNIKCSLNVAQFLSSMTWKMDIL